MSIHPTAANRSPLLFAIAVLSVLTAGAAPASRQPALHFEPQNLGEICEAAPIVWHNRLVLMKCIRPVSGGGSSDFDQSLEDVETGATLSRFAQGYGLASALVHRGTLYVFASRFENGTWNDVALFKSRDLKNWEHHSIVNQEKEHLFNSSACASGRGFTLAYETDDPKYIPFTIKFATSPDLKTWTKIPDAIFGPDRYAACPCLRYVNGWYYLLYLEHRQPRWFFETYLARSRDLKSWTLSPANPVLTPGLDDGINASDPDIIEFKGKTYLYYSVGDQRTWFRLKRAVYPGPLSEFFACYFDADQSISHAPRNPIGLGK